MTKERIEQKIKEILSKDKRFTSANIEINFDGKELEKTINKSVSSLKSLLIKK